MIDKPQSQNKEIQQDAQEAARMGPMATTREIRVIDPTAPPPGEVTAALRTPRWLWAWILPALLVWMLYMTRTVLGPFVIAAVLAYIFSMVIDQIQARLHWRRGLVVGGLYLIVLTVLGVGLFFGAEALYGQTRAFIVGGPDIVARALEKFMGTTQYTFGGQVVDAHSLAARVNEGVSNYFGSAGGDAIHLAGLVVSRSLDLLLVIIVSFYLLMSGKDIGAYMMKFVPEASRARTGYIAGRIHTVLGAYLRGQLLLIVIMSVAAFIVLLVLQVPYALPLAIMTGFLEILPLVGPAIAATLAAVAALSGPGPSAALAVVVAYLILRQLEDQLVMPFVVGRAVELHPIVTIFAVLAGGAMVGALGMLLAVPVAAAIRVILDFLYPTDPDRAMAQAARGIRKAVHEAEARHEEPAPAAKV
ncbi:MAG: AI-2E family transporter [Chloroflexota bacterium]|nr:AI-2E family transporter [Chloroflexota bacterium]